MALAVQLALKRAAGAAEPGPNRPAQRQSPLLVVGGDQQGPEHLAAGVAGQPPTTTTSVERRSGSLRHACERPAR
ncbi:hypothetical protein ACWEP5_24595 [Nocardia niigatensis]